MIRFKYTFTNADGKTSWNDFLTEQQDIYVALEEFSRYAPLFVLRNLRTVEAYEIQKYSSITGYKECIIHDVAKEIATFIENQLKA